MKETNYLFLINVTQTKILLYVLNVKLHKYYFSQLWNLIIDNALCQNWHELCLLPQIVKFTSLVIGWRRHHHVLFSFYSMFSPRLQDLNIYDGHNSKCQLSYRKLTFKHKRNGQHTQGNYKALFLHYLINSHKCCSITEQPLLLWWHASPVSNSRGQYSITIQLQ